jgi:glycosyltransferase involved in cell wall biosynthesis
MNWKSEWIRSRTGRFCLGKMAEFYDRWICTPEAVRGQAAKGCSPGNGLRFSVGIPHYNRGGLIYRPLFNLLDHPAVAEVVIVDDGSREEEYRALLSFVDSLNCGERIKIFRREENRGALLTKLECVERSRAEWVLVLDSDNTAFRSYMDALGKIRNPNPSSFYCSSWAWPLFPFHDFAGMRIDFEKSCEWTRSGLLKRVFIFNDGNYLVNREAYRDSVKSIGQIASDVADVMVVNYNWMSGGGGIVVLPGVSYFHRVDASSFWNRTAEPSKRRVLEIYSFLDSGKKMPQGLFQ